jgi:hypothetical protein
MMVSTLIEDCVCGKPCLQLAGQDVCVQRQWLARQSDALDFFAAREAPWWLHMMCVRELGWSDALRNGMLESMAHDPQLSLVGAADGSSVFAMIDRPAGAQVVGPDADRREVSGASLAAESARALHDQHLVFEPRSLTNERGETLAHETGVAFPLLRLIDHLDLRDRLRHPELVEAGTITPEAPEGALLHWRLQYRMRALPPSVVHLCEKAFALPKQKHGHGKHKH